MQFDKFQNPRHFHVGVRNEIVLRHVGLCQLESDELLTIQNTSQQKYDIVCKSWGFYATPSITPRLVKEGLLVALIQNHLGREFIVLVNNKFKQDFGDYCLKENLKVMKWLS